MTLFTTNSRFAAPWGNDALDGFGWQTAKLTIYGAIDALPSNRGHVYFADNTQPNPSDVSKGIWLCSGTPPNSDWRSPGNIIIEGVHIQAGGVAGPSQEGASLGITNASDTTKPAIWLGPGWNRKTFRHVHAAGPTPVFIGPAGVTFSGAAPSTISYHFENCSFQTVGAVPSVQMLGFIFWGFWDDCMFTGKSAVADAATDGHVNAVMDGAYLQYFSRCSFNGGGVKDKSGLGDIHMIDCTSENMDGNPNAPDLWIQNAARSTGQCTVRNFSHYDSTCPLGSTRVEVNTGGSFPYSWDASQLIVDGGWQMNQGVGPHTRIASDALPLVYVGATTRATNDTVGFGLGGAISGRHPGGQWQFAPQTALGTNQCVTPASWKIDVGSTLTRTLAVLGPDGRLSATRLADAAGEASSAACYAKLTGTPDLTYTVGDYIFWGSWVRRATAGDGGSLHVAPYFSGGTVAAGTNINNTPPPLPEQSLGVWEWVSGWARCSAKVGGISLYSLIQGKTGVTEIAYPTIFTIPVASMTDQLAAEMNRYMGTWSFEIPAGEAGTFTGQKFIAQGGLGVGNSVAATEVIGKAVVKKIQVFDASGASLGYVPVYSSIT